MQRPSKSFFDFNTLNGDVNLDLKIVLFSALEDDLVLKKPKEQLPSQEDLLIIVILITLLKLVSIKKQIVVTDWSKKKPTIGIFLYLSLNSDQRKILRGTRKSDCTRLLHLQLPREGKLNDGDILLTNHKKLFIEIRAKEEDLIEINSESTLDLLKAAYHLGNRHVDIELKENILLIRNDYVIENLLKSLDLKYIKVQRKFFPEEGAFKHE